MSIITLPTWFDVAECEMSLVPEVRGFSGPFGGPTEVQDLLGDRWRMRVTLPDGDFTWGGRTEALMNRLRGGVDWLRLYHLAKPAPRGTARGSMVLSGAVAQGASALTISGVAASSTLRAGDMLGHNSEQLFQVFEDATANVSGVITVNLANRARKAIASGQAIVWDKPSIPFQLTDTSGVPTAFIRGRARGQQVEFVEAWT
jgi:hypothetical protein